MNNNRIFGYNRDKLIIETVERFKCLNSEQIEILIFRESCNIDSAKRQSQNRLSKLVEKKIIKRYRMDLDESYKYFVNDFQQKEHIVLLNWMIIHYLVKHPYEKIYYMEYQKDYKIKIPDLFLVTYNEFTKQYKSMFFEMDKTISNKFDAVEKYNKLRQNPPNDEFTRLTKFPEIYIATTDMNRLNEIMRLINNKNINKYNLKFNIDLIWNIKEELKYEMVKNFRNKFIHGIGECSISLR